MHYFLKCRLSRRGLFLFLLVHAAIILAMESPERNLSPKRVRKPDRILPVFDPKKEAKERTSWNELIPNEILVTPDGKGLIVTKRGNVESILFGDSSNSKIMIEHPNAKKNFPMVAVSQRKDGLLTLVSAANLNKINTEFVAEYIVYCNEWTKKERLDRQIQAISLDPHGKFLAIAHKRSVVVTDLETYQTSEQFFRGIANTDHCIVDVAINGTGTYLIVAGSQGGIQLMSLSKENGAMKLSFLKEAIVGADIIKKIYYPTSEEIIYATENGQAKIITLDGLLRPNDENAKITDFVIDSHYHQITADRYDIATVHWGEKTPILKNSSSTMAVYRKYKDDIEKFILEIPVLEEPYTYIKESGQYSIAKGHLLHVASGSNCVIALATDGNIRVWDLPSNNTTNNIVYESDKKDEKIEAENSPSQKERAKDNKKRRSRSNSEKNTKSNLTSSDGENKKKTSPRGLTDLLKSASNSNPTLTLPMRETSPQRGGGAVDRK